MSTKRRVPHSVFWLLLWLCGIVLVLVGAYASARYEKDPNRIPLRSGEITAVNIDPDDSLAIYSPIGSSYADCVAVSPGLTVEPGLSGFAHIDGATRWRRIHHLEAAVAGTYNVRCEGDSDLALAAAVPGSRLGRLIAAWIVNAAWLLVLGIVLMALWRTIRRAYHYSHSRLKSGWPGR